MCVKREPMAMRRSMRACAVRARARRSRGIYHYFALFYGETSTRDEPIPVPGRTFSGRAY